MLFSSNTLLVPKLVGILFNRYAFNCSIFYRQYYQVHPKEAWCDWSEEATNFMKKLCAEETSLIAYILPRKPE